MHAKIPFVCPHTNSAHMDDDNHRDYFVNMYHIILLRSCAVVVFGNWKESLGATGEISFAAAHDIPIFYSTVKLKQWWRDHNGK